jgi:hypothetical protein
MQLYTYNAKKVISSKFSFAVPKLKSLFSVLQHEVELGEAD